MEKAWYSLLFLLYTTVPPVSLYHCLRLIYQKKHKSGWHLLYFAKYLITLSFLPLLFVPQINLGLMPQSPWSVFLLILTFILAFLGIKPAMKNNVLQHYLAGVFAAFMEEILYRSVLFGLSQAIWNNHFISIILTSIAFGGWHLKNIGWYQNKQWVLRQFLYTGGIYGPLFAILRIMTGDIYLAILWHFLTDAYVSLTPKWMRWTIINDRNKGEGFRDV